MTKLQVLRQKAGLTQKELSEKAGVNFRHFQKLDNGEKNIDGVAAITAVRIAKALGCTVEDLMEEDL